MVRKVIFSGAAVMVGAMGAGALGAAQLSTSGGKVLRPATLFEAGDYPDKGLNVTPEQLDALVTHFYATGARRPVKIEHQDSPLDPFGEVVGLVVYGNQLHGLLEFEASADSLLRSRGAKGLSVGLLRGDPLDLEEVSLVLSPRVATAGFFSTDDVSAKVAAYVAQGKLTPAAAPFATKLLAVAPSVMFGEGEAAAPVASLVDELLAALPVAQAKGAQVVAPLPVAPDAGQTELKDAVFAVAKKLGANPDKMLALVEKQGKVPA